MQGRSLDLHVHVFGRARQHHEVLCAWLCLSFRPRALQHLHRCWLVHFWPFERTPFLPMLVCAQIVNSATGDIRSGCTSDDDSSASRSSCSSVRASTCAIRSLTGRWHRRQSNHQERNVPALHSMRHGPRARCGSPPCGRWHQR